MAPDTRYEAVVRAIHDVREVSPQYNPEAAIVFYLEPGAQAPLGWQYSVFDLANLVFGTDGGFTEYGGRNEMMIDDLMVDRMVAFRLGVDGSATLLRELPETSGFSTEERRQYNPGVHFHPETTPPELLRFFPSG